MNTTRSKIVFLVSAVALLVVTATVEVRAQERSVIRVKGSNVMAGMVDALGKSYMKGHPNTTVVVSGGGKQSGLKALYERAAEVVMSSQRISPQLKAIAARNGVNLAERLIGWDGIALITHPKNPVNDLSIDQVAKIFTGQYNTWSELGGPESLIILYVAETPRSGTGEFFKEFCLKGVPYSKGANTRRYSRYVVKAVAEMEEAIGYCSLAEALQAEKKNLIKIMGIRATPEEEAVVASRKTVEDRRYPLIRPLYLVYDKRLATKGVREFVSYCANKGLGLE